MKLPPFEYLSPESLDQAVTALRDRGDEAMVLAGGQSLVPTLAFRLSAPEVLVDLRKVPGLDGIAVDDGGVRLGARVRWCDVEESVALRSGHPLLVAAVGHVAHHAIRNRGTVGGSLAHGDPAAELPCVAVTCGARLVAAGADGERSLDAGEFFLGPLTTALAPDEILTEVRFPPWPAERRWAFEEFSRRRGDFALAGVAIHYDLDHDGRAADVRIGVLGATDLPRRVGPAERALEGTLVDAAAVAAASEAASASVEPPDDFHAPADYRRALVGTLVGRGLEKARDRG